MIRTLKLFPPKLWFFLFSLVFFGVSLFRLPWAGASTDEKIVQKYDRDHATLQEAVIQYHTNMNTLFNKSLKLMLSGKGDLKPPEDDVCPENNVSTYCVAARAVQEYEGFRIALKTHSGYTNDKLTEEQAQQYLSNEQVLSSVDQRNDSTGGRSDKHQNAWSSKFVGAIEGEERPNQPCAAQRAVHHRIQISPKWIADERKIDGRDGGRNNYTANAKEV
jgi:hypothetical protein